MNEQHKLGLAVVVSTIVGAAIGATVTYKMLIDQVDDALNQISRARTERAQQKKVHTVMDKPDSGSPETEAPQRVNTERVAYSKAVKPYQAEPEEELPARIRFITPEEYDAEDTRHEKRELTYYHDPGSDPVLADQEGNPVEYPHDLIGTEWEDVILTEGTVYVRNDNLCVDYAVELLQVSFVPSGGR